MEEKKIIKEIKKTYNLIKSNNGESAFYVNLGFIKCSYDTLQIDYDLFGEMVIFNHDYYYEKINKE